MSDETTVDRRDVMAALAQLDAGEIGLELVEDDPYYPIVRTTTGWHFRVFTDDASPSSGFDYIDSFRRPDSEEWVWVGERPAEHDPVLWYQPANERAWISLWAPAARN